MKFRSRTLLAKIQSAVDVDPTPAGADACITENLTWTPYAGDRITRDRDRTFFGANSQINVGPRAEFSFDVELGQAAAAGTAPAFGVFLRACGFSETIDAGVDVEYNPVSSGQEMAAVYFVDNETQEQKSLNCMGTFSIDMTAGQLPKLNFSGFRGSYNKPATVSAYTIDTSAWEDAVPVSKGNTVVLTLDGYSGCVNSFTVDIGNQIESHDEPNCAGTNITGREVTGQIVIKAPELGTKDLFSAIESHSGSVNTVAIAVEHTDGSRPSIFIDLPQVQLNDIQRTDVRGELYYTIPFTALPTDAGDDEIKLTF